MIFNLGKVPSEREIWWDLMVKFNDELPPNEHCVVLDGQKYFVHLLPCLWRNEYLRGKDWFYLAKVQNFEGYILVLNHSFKSDPSPMFSGLVMDILDFTQVSPYSQDDVLMNFSSHTEPQGE